MDEGTPTAPEGQGGFLLGRVHHVSRRVLGRMLRAHGIAEFNPGQGRILFALWQADDVTVTDLARRTSLEKSTLTRMLDRLEADGLVRRDRPATDRRTVRVVLTPRTRALLTTFTEVSAEMSAIFYRGFSAEEIQAFEGALVRILDNLATPSET